MLTRKSQNQPRGKLHVINYRNRKQNATHKQAVDVRLFLTQTSDLLK